MEFDRDFVKGMAAILLAILIMGICGGIERGTIPM